MSYYSASFICSGALLMTKTRVADDPDGNYLRYVDEAEFLHL